ncbi:MAG TPA: transporter [Rhizobiaceae bacterium]|nr:transporter [Rhizobiaceae bacterium]
MPTGEQIQQYVNGAWRLMMGRPDGEQLLDISADGFWNSFFAIIVALPPMAVGWVAMANAMGGDAFGARLGVVFRLVFVDLVTWVLPLVALGAAARLVGIAPRYVAYVVASNWGSVVFLWLMVIPSLLDLVWPTGREVTAAISLLLLFATMVLSWRLTNAILGMGAAVATGVFAGMFLFSLLLMVTLQSLLGLAT